MTPQEITAFARIVNLTNEFAGKQVIIQREDGQYFAGRGRWTPDPEMALIHDYDADRVSEQLFQVELEFGVKWTVKNALK